MKTIKEILASLPECERARLRLAMQYNIAQFIIYEPGRFVGVYADRVKNLNIEETAGVWSVGSITQRNNPS